MYMEKHGETTQQMASPWHPGVYGSSAMVDF